MAQLTNEYTFLGTLAIIAITPAVCEEVFFRGLVLSGLRREFSMKGCMILQAIMFGVAHYSLFRFAGTAIMGAVLTFVVFRTGSILCTMLMHMIFNGMSCFLWAYGFAEGKSLETFFGTWKYAIIAVTILGLGLFFLLKPKDEDKNSVDPVLDTA
jgi:sodium transport system permease protein